MELIDQHTKKIMEGCKTRAREMGLSFQEESLEYIVTNRDLIELSPKLMIPTLYDYWVHDVDVLKEKGKYELYPGNPYETVINTRPAISFYNDNNPDWLNVMIFYHVIAHIDFFQNNLFFRHTWDYDFTGEALSDKRMIAKLRSEKGRWLDYTIEFARSIDNIVGYHRELSYVYQSEKDSFSRRLNYYFDVFLQTVKKVKISEYIKEIDRYNESMQSSDSLELGEKTFFSEVDKKYSEFEAYFKKFTDEKKSGAVDLFQFLMDHSEFLNKEENKWMLSVLEVVRKTALFFQPQIRTKIMNEGWASYWHETLFLQDDRIKGHEVDFARVNAGVTSLPRVGLNPYALGMRLFYHIEQMAEKGAYSFEFSKIQNAEQRKEFDQKTGTGKDFIFRVRENLCDFTFISHFIDQDFIDQYKLFVAGKRMNQTKMVWEYYVKSRDKEAYKSMLLDSLYHPPSIEIDQRNSGRTLYLNHRFEEKPLVKEFIHNTLLGIEYFWGNPVQLETSEAIVKPSSQRPIHSLLSHSFEEPEEPEITWQRVLYTMYDKKMTKRIL